MRLIVVFYKHTCGYCHKLINEPIENLPQSLKAAGFMFVDAADNNNPVSEPWMKELFDPNSGVPQTYVVDINVAGKLVGFQPAKDFQNNLLGQINNN
jgi:hypothetical protein